MEEKERYEWDAIEGVEWIRDTKIGYLLYRDDMKKLAYLLNQQSKRIKELEEELDDAKRDYIPKLEFGLQRANKMGRDAEKEIQQLKHKLAIAEKALELACERVKYFEELQDKEMGFYEFFGYESNYDLQGIIEQYKEQAEKEVKGE